MDFNTGFDLTKRIGLGALIAASGAFVWALIFCGSLATAAYAVLFASWFVVPIGGVLGALMPRFVRGQHGINAFQRGTLVGIGVAALTTSITTVFAPELTMAICCFLTMTPVCGLWVGIWAYLWREREPTPSKTT